MASQDSFCGGPFWDTNQFLSGSWPLFSPCFQALCFVCVPCGLLFLVSPFYALWLRHRNTTLILTFCRMNAAKLVSQLSLVIITFTSLLKRHGQAIPPSSPMSVAEILTDVIKMAAFMLLAALGQYERKKGLAASVLQFTFWVVYTLGQIIPAYTNLKLQIYIEDPLRAVLFFGSFFLCVTLVMLNCWSEHPGIAATRRGYMCIDEQEPCPLEAASAVSGLTFHWIFGLLRVGQKKSLEESSMWSVPKDILSDELSRNFDGVWRDQINGTCSRGMMYSRSHLTEEGTGLESGSTSTSSSSTIHSNTNTTTTNSSNSYGGSVVSKETVKENNIYHERTRLTNRTEPQAHTRYTQVFEQNLLKEEKGNRGDQQPRRMMFPSLTRCLWRLYRTDVAIIITTKLLGDVLIVIVPLIFRLFLVYLQTTSDDEHRWQGYGLCVLLLLALQFQAFISGRCHLLAFEMGMSVKTMLASAIYKKILSLKVDKTKDTHPDKMLCLLSEDCVQAQEFCTRFSHAITTPLLVLAVVAVTYVFAGPAAIIGLSSLGLLVPFHILVLLVLTEIRTRMRCCQNKRLRVLQEIINGIKTIKLFAWEVPFQSKIQYIRAMEMTSLLKMAYVHVLTGIVNNMSVYLAALTMCVSVVILDDHSTSRGPETVFMMMAYLSYLRKPIKNIARFVNLTVQTHKACIRMEEFLMKEELSVDAVSVSPGAEHPVMIDSALLKWNDQSAFKLKNVNLTVRQESLVAVVGPEGSGKSSLLAGILGEMNRRRGVVSRRGTLAYVPQEPWIQSSALKDNILFGKVYRERKVKAVMSACQLQQELSSLGVDEDTIIGKNGFHLDYTQQKRLTLARALYHDCDLYILDEPFHGLESHLAGAVFNNVIGSRGLLKNTTRIIATNCVHILPSVDNIIVMRQGKIVASGTYEDLTRYEGPLVQYLKDQFIEDRHHGRGWEDIDHHDEISSIRDSMWNRVERLTTSDYTGTSGDEDRYRPLRDRQTSFAVYETSGTQTDATRPLLKERNVYSHAEISYTQKVPVSLFKYYITGIGRWSVACCVLLIVMSQWAWAMSNVWLLLWACDTDIRNTTSSVEERNSGNQLYILVFVLFGVGQCLFLGCFHFLFWTSIVRTSRGFHHVILGRLFGAPLGFFYDTPLGNIMEVFTKDIETVDNRLPFSTKQSIYSLIVLTSTMVVIIATTPMCILVVIPAVAMGLLLLRLYLHTTTQLGEMSLSSQTPLHNHFCDGVSGAITIRAFHQEERFVKDFSRHLDRTNSYWLAINVAYRWVILHLTTISNFLIFVASIFQVTFTKTDPEMAALTIFFALQLPSILCHVVSALSNLRRDIISMERIKHYSEYTQEGKRKNPDLCLAANWPFPGNIEFYEYSTGNVEGTGVTLSDVRIRIDGGEKIGVISTKHRDLYSFLSALFRTVEATRGTIYIDGVDISNIGLHDLRSRLTILPQDPSLFSGTIRHNLDPLSEFPEEEIWSALGRVYLKQYVVQLSDQLDFDVGDSGNNLSVGHRQLLCLARTLLHKTNILVVEESSALPVTDLDTHHFISNIIRMAFQACTIITVTNMPQTVINSDRVLVIEDGCVKEFESPVTLLNNPASVFYSLARDAGLVV